jgi:hypothetical protein
MQTEVLDASQVQHSSPQLNVMSPGARQPALRPLPPVGPAPTTAPRPQPSPVVQTSAEHELEAFLQGESNIGTIRALHAALLFNAGLALTGVLAWELWMLLSF